ncbi:MAG: nucleotidyl transferase AbiEii/AbiGii toxin family protein [Chitinivibrionales bacterium]|nr:nucleotidyl transferase AbiEii/AbiGii toxin family protein [Chitinivibrionales bacterium]
MPSAVMDMLEKHHCTTTEDYRNVLKEIIQEIALFGLYRSNFFDVASFYGGTALRIFYGLDRFSQDLDFSLDEPDPSFDISPFCASISNELNAFGFDVTVGKKNKNTKSPLESAFTKAGTLVHFVRIGLKDRQLSTIVANGTLKIMLEIDICPPGNAEFEIKYQLNPIPYHVRLYTLPFLFAGKIHALLYRKWKSGRVKGRDMYDYLWFLSKGVHFNLKHLQHRMVQTGDLSEGESLEFNKVMDRAAERFSEIDYGQAKKDVLPFLKNPEKISIWSEDFFKSVTKENLKTTE